MKCVYCAPADMDPFLRQAIARIEIVQDGKSVSRGTGTLVTDRLVLTAFHVVADRKADPPTPHPGTIRLTFRSHVTDAVIHESAFDSAADWVLLECTDPPLVRPMPLAELNESFVGFETFGFPDAQPLDGLVQSGTIENHDAELYGTHVLQLFVKQAVYGAPENGASGSPLIVDGALIGVVRTRLTDRKQETAAGTLYACPIGPILDRCGALLPIPDPCRGLPGLPRRPLPDMPFRFLERFTSAEAEIFFGRNRDIRQVYTRLTAEDGPPVLLLYGQAGVGKSSFLDAGVLPRLEWTYRVRYVRRDRTKPLSETLARTIAPDDRSTADIGALWRLAEQRAGRPLIVILDQLEEVFTQPGEYRDDLDTLARVVAAAYRERTAAPRGRLVLGFRKEWLPEIQKPFGQASVEFSTVFLEVLGRASVIEVVTGLTQTRRLRDKYNLQLAPGLADLIADGIGSDPDSPIAPALRILLSKMWEQAVANNRSAPAFSVELYRRLRSEGIFLRDFLDQQLKQLEQSHRVDTGSGLALDVLAHHASQAAAQQRSAEDLGKRYRHVTTRLPSLIQEMKQLFLLVDPAADRASDAAATRLAHDTLAPLVRQRFDESDRPGQRARRILESRVVDWRDGRAGECLDAADVTVVENGLSGMRALEDDEHRLVEASRRKRHADRKRARLYRQVAAAGVVAIVVLAGVSLWLRAQAESERRGAVAAARMAQAREVQTDDPTLAALLLAELDGYPEPADGVRLAQGILAQRMSTTIFRGNDEFAFSAAFSPDGRHVLASNSDGTAWIWPTDGGMPIVLQHLLDRDTSSIKPFLAEYDPTGRRIVTYWPDAGTARIWNTDGTRGEAIPRSVPLHTIVFSGDGTRLVTTAWRDRTAFVWDATKPAVMPLYELPHSDELEDAVFDPKAQRVLTRMNSGEISVWTLNADGTATQLRLPVPAEFIAAVARAGVIEFSIMTAAFTQDGERIILGTSNGSILLVPVDGRPSGTLWFSVFKDDVVRELVLSPDGRRVAIMGDDEIQLWDFDAKRPHLVKVLPSDTSFASPNPVAFSRDGAIVATGMGNGSIWIWTSGKDFEDLSEIRGHSGFVSAINFDRDGRRLVSTSSDGTVRIWPVERTAPQPVTIGNVGGDVAFAAFAPNGEHIAAVIGNELKLWRTSETGVQQTSSTPVDDPTDVGLQVDAAGSQVLERNRKFLHLWRLNARREFQLVEQTDSQVAASFLNDGSVMMIDRNGAIRRVAPGAATSVPQPSLPSKYVANAAFSPDGSLLFTRSSVDEASVWSVGDSRLLFKWSTPNLLSAAFDDAGSRLATGSTLGIQMWAIDRGRQIPAAPSDPNSATLGNSVSQPVFIAFSKDGRQVLTRDGEDRGFVAAADARADPLTLAGQFKALSFDRTASRVLGISSGGRIVRWDLAWNLLTRDMDTATNACLTADQRIRYLGEDAGVAGRASAACEARKRSRVIAPQR